MLDDMSSAESWNAPAGDTLRMVAGNLLEPADLKDAFAQQPAVVFHLAAFFANQNSVEHPEDDLMVNGLGTLRVLGAAKNYRADRVVYASSGSAFKDAEAPLPLSEDYVTVNLATPYQITKMLGELYSNYFHEPGSLETVRVRFFNSFGPGEVPGLYRNVIPNFIYKALQGEALPITGDGSETRDFTYVDDVVEGLLRAGRMKSAAGHAVNLGSGRETKIVDLADRINRMTGNSAGLVYLPRRTWDGESRRVASIEKAQQILGYQPTVDLDAGLARTLNWFRDNWTDISRSTDFDEAILLQSAGAAG